MRPSPPSWRSSAQSAMPMTDPARLFPDYLTAVEHLARTVDTWRR